LFGVSSPTASVTDSGGLTTTSRYVGRASNRSRKESADKGKLQVERSSLLEWDVPDAQKVIYSTFRTIARAALLASPTLSSLREETRRKTAGSPLTAEERFEWHDVFQSELGSDDELLELGPVPSRLV
jgi:hypothetical protein